MTNKVAEISQQVVDDLQRRLDESLAQQAATADVLKIISRSTFDLQTVLETLIKSAVELSGANRGSIFLREGDVFPLKAASSTTPEFLQYWAANPPKAGRGSATSRVIASGKVEVIPDVLEDPDMEMSAGSLNKIRAALGVPMLRNDKVEGVIVLTRPEPGPFSKSQIDLVQTFADQAMIAIENARLFNEVQAKTADLSESLQQQTATAEVLKVISRSAFNLQRVLETLVESAARLCEADNAFVYQRGLDGYRLAATHGFSKDYEDFMRKQPVQPGRGTLIGRTTQDARIVHIPDVLADREYRWPESQQRGGYRTMLGVPLLREGDPIGVFAMTRSSVKPFTENQIALLQTFSDQAVIAIENTRLFNETKEALERQTATADILRVISQSPTDVKPVFDAIVLTAVRLFRCDLAFFLRCQGATFSQAALAGSEGSQMVPDRTPVPIDPVTNFPSRAIVSKKNLHLPDWSTIDLPEHERQIRDRYGINSSLFLPLLRAGECVGLLALAGKQANIFGESEIALAESFRDQALIAIENARLFNEVQTKTADLQESLQHQTATSEVLQVISRSPGELDPVFQTILASATSICDAQFGLLLLYEDGGFRCASTFNLPPAFAETFLRNPVIRPPPIDPLGRLIETGQLVHVVDVMQEPAYLTGFPPIVELVELGGARTLLLVPMLRENDIVGVIAIFRQTVHAFSDKQIDLVTSFGNQAVIAIENAHLLGELRERTDDLSESLQQQTATADVLKVISRSAFDLKSVLTTLTESAKSLCGASLGIICLRDGEVMRLQAESGCTQAFVDFMQANPIRPGRETITGRIFMDGKAVHVADVRQDAEYRFGDAPTIGAYRAVLAVPLMRDGAVEGVLLLGRPEPGPFSQRQQDLVQTFADQAVIAIENVRLFDEVQARTRDLSESLQQQTAVGDVLKIISRSTFDLQPVLETLVGTAARLCDADMAFIMRREGDVYRAGAAVGFAREYVDFLKNNPLTVDRGSITGRAVLERRTVQILDVATDPEYSLRESTSLASQHTALGVPLLRGNEPIGVIVIARRRVQEFTQKQIDLVTTFADQAVIAIENVRLFDELRQRTDDLSEALTYQTGSGNILRVIASSPTEVEPVLKAIVESACELCEAYDAVVLLKDGDNLRFSAHHGPIGINLEKWPISRNWTAGRAFVDRKPVHVCDMSSAEGDEFPDSRELSQFTGTAGIHTILAAPLLRENESIGAILLRRTEVQPFNEKQIALLQTFADQAVIAIGNVRLFDEVQARTHDLSEALQFQTATSDVLKVISSSPDTLQPVLDVIVETSRHLCNAATSTIFLLRDGRYHIAALSGAAPEYLQFLQANPIAPDQLGSSTARAAREKRTIHIPDIGADPEFGQGHMAVGHRRALLSVPLMREGVPIGMITMAQSYLTPFTERQIEIVQTFADQAVIAIENTRLFGETQEALERQTATADILKVIASSPSDVRPVFEAIAARANSLVGGFSSTVFRFIDGVAHLMAFTPTTPEADEVLKSTFPTSVDAFPPFRMARDGEVALIEDTETLTDEILDIARARGFRSMLFAPLMNKGIAIGLIAVTRLQPGNFSDHHVQLLRTFADQAVIAIENARLFDEVQERTRELSLSLDELRTAQDRLVQTEKLASLGQLTAGIAHEIKNPLNFVNNFSALSGELIDELNDLLKPAKLDGKTRDEIDELTQMLKGNLDKVVQHGKRADSIVKNMLLHSREGSGERRSADINAIVEESLNLAYHGARAEKSGFNITLQRDLDPSAGIIDLYPQEITRVFLNLISNGFYAANKRKEAGHDGFEPLLTASTKNLGNKVEIRIRDNGTGIPAEVKEKMFNPFFTTKPAGEGTGLGLSMSHDIIVKQHGGRIDVETEPGAFTEFIITLPRAAAQAKAGGRN